MYLRPTELSEALAALSRGGMMVLAGGTDFYPARVGRPVTERILDITALDSLRGIREEAGHIRIGALTTWSELIAHPLPEYFAGLKAAAREVGGMQIQNAGTIAGNLCNASPAADGIPPLLALGAQVELASAEKIRRLPVSEFVLGNRRTVAGADELLTAVLVPCWGSGARSNFLKLGSRRYLVISIVMVSAVLETSPDEAVTRAGVSVGACSEVAQRLPALEKRLLGRPLSAALADLPTPADLDGLKPITDVRGTEVYRRDAALTLVRRALRELAGE
jgi:CO/xanthine dehydrogenase FAD-binding subunit